MSNRQAGGFQPWELKALRALLASGGGGGVGVPTYQTAGVVLDHAAILTIPTTTIDIAPAPGAGLAIVPITAWLSVQIPTTPYTNVDGGSGFVTKFASLLPNNIGFGGGALDTAPTDLMNSQVGICPSVGQAVAENQAWQFGFDNAMAGDLTGGAIGNIVRYAGLYSILNLDTGAFV